MNAVNPVPPCVVGTVPIVFIPFVHDGATPTPPDIRTCPEVPTDKEANTDVDDAYTKADEVNEVVPVPP